MENRLEKLRLNIDKIIKEKQPNKDRYFYVHLYGVSHFCTLLALRRKLNVEIATTSGMLHDIYPVLFNNYENHGVNGAEHAKRILKEINLYTDEEIQIISNAIARHSEKNKIQDPYDEILKDADVMSHCLYNHDFLVQDNEIERYNNIMIELGIEKQ